VGCQWLRVQANLSGGKPLDLPQALLPVEALPAAHFKWRSARIGLDSAAARCRAVVTRAGHLQFMHAVSGKVLLAEPQIQYFALPTAFQRSGRPALPD